MKTNHQMNYYDYSKSLDAQGVMHVIGGGVNPEPEPETDYVDLGLPSGTLWGADLVEEDDGEGNKVYYARCIKDDEGHELYFAWGETQGYTRIQVDDKVRKFGENDYKFFSEIGYTKYNETDGKTKLDADDDAATVNFGPEWKMPTLEDFRELLEETDYRIDNDCFPTFTKNGKSLVLPMYGYVYGYYFYDFNDTGSCIWTSDLYSNNNNEEAYYLSTTAGGTTFITRMYRHNGSIVVPVKKKIEK